MITYKNISFSAKTFYGVKFEPGETKAVPGYINCQGMVRVNNIPIDTITPAPTSEIQEEPKTDPISVEVTPTVSRGRKKKSTEPVKEEVAETQEIKIEDTSKEETSNGNPS